MKIGLQIPSFKYPGGTTAIRPKLKEIVTTAEEAGFYSLTLTLILFIQQRPEAEFSAPGTLSGTDHWIRIGI